MRYKAFLSSTFTDLEKHRIYAIEQMRKAGFDVIPMEDWTADSATPRSFDWPRARKFVAIARPAGSCA